MESRHGIFYMPERWVVWTCRERIHYNQLDGLLLLPDDRRAILFECKLRNTMDAIYQMAHYKRLLGLLLPNWILHAIEVCKYYDPWVKAPDGTQPFFIREPIPEVGLDYSSNHIVFLYGGK